jgi:DNA repair protein RadC
LTIPLSHSLASLAGSHGNVPVARIAIMTMLYVREDSGFQEAGADVVLARARALISQRFRVGSPVLRGSARVSEYLQFRLGGLEHEVFGIVHLDTRHRLIAVEDLFRGTIDTATVHSREVVKSALKRNTAGIILFHNHPSGDGEPSLADYEITRRLKSALDLVEVRVLDHLIIADHVFSFAEHGLL